jgi:hypothetical protein
MLTVLTVRGKEGGSRLWARTPLTDNTGFLTSSADKPTTKSRGSNRDKLTVHDRSNIVASATGEGG